MSLYDKDLQEITKAEVVGLQKLMKYPIFLYPTFTNPLRRGGKKKQKQKQKKKKKKKMIEKDNISFYCPWW